MITKIQVKNFKSYQRGVLPLASLTVLIGANGSGKSNIIEALRLLAIIGEGEGLSILGNPHGESPLRGKINNLGYRGAKSSQISCEVKTFEGPNHFEINLGLGNDGDIHVSQEQITGSIITKNHVRWLRGIVFLEPEPNAMRSSGHKTDKSIEKHGENLSGVLYHLCQDSNIKTEILEFVRSIPEQEIEDISFIETTRGEVMLQLTETFGGISTPYDATTLSDGTLRVLSIAAVMYSAPEQSLIVIEEIDIHPSRAESLLKRIYSIAQARNLRVIISSHNPALLDDLPDEAVPEIVFCYRSPNDGSSQLVRLRDIPDYPELIAQGTVGQLMTKGLLEQFVKYHPGSEQKKQKAMEWLANIRK